MEPTLHSPGKLRHQRQNVLALVASERRQHEVGEILVDPLSLVARADSDSEAGVLLRPERLLHAFQAIVSAGASPRANASAADRQLHLVHHHEQILGGAPEGPTNVVPERPAAQVHECLRLHQPDLHASDSPVRDLRLAVFFPAVKTPNVGEVVDQPPADVVTCRGVIAARIPETDYDLQGLSNNYFLPAGSPPFLPEASPPPPSPSTSSPRPLPMTSASGAHSAAPS